MPQSAYSIEEIDNSIEKWKEPFYWDDFDFNVNNLRVNPATSKPDFDQNEGEYLFDAASTETVVGNKITKHQFKIPCAEWRPHIHWAQADSGDVVWELQYKFWSAGSIEPVSWITLTTSSKVFTYTSGVLHQMSNFSPIDMSSYTSLAIHVKVKISRLGANAADTYTGDVRFLGFDFHVPIDGYSSELETSKE